MIDRQKFFAYAKANIFGGSMSAMQAHGTEVTLGEWERRGLTDLRWLAYMLATKKHETAHTMQPVRETLASTDAQARANLAGVWYAETDPTTKQSYYGRGDVQMTLKRNYATMNPLVQAAFPDRKIDLVNNPDQAMVPEIAATIMFEGMTKGDSHVGDFTGKSLEDYFNSSTTDWINARRIINGTDHAADIAETAMKFYAALTGEAPPPPLLRYGSAGDDVKSLQSALISLGLYAGKIDGDFGPKTLAAVFAFQRTVFEGDDIDGVAGGKTQRAIAAAVAMKEND